jgi:hypothetical protein
LSEEIAHADLYALVHPQPLISFLPAQRIAIEKAIPNLELPRRMDQYIAIAGGPPSLFLHTNPRDSRGFDEAIPSMAVCRQVNGYFIYTCLNLYHYAHCKV